MNKSEEKQTRNITPSPLEGEGAPQGRMRGLATSDEERKLNVPQPLIRQASPATFSRKGRRDSKIDRLGQNYRLRAVMHPQFAKDAGQVGLDGGLGDAEVEGDLLVQPPGSQAFENA